MNLNNIENDDSHSPLIKIFSRFSLNQYCIISGAILGIISFLLIYGPLPLDCTYNTWLFNGFVEHDITQHYSGWLMFRHSPWAWPIGMAKNMAYPFGISVSYTDSIPLCAIIFKLFVALLPDNFQYFGLWILLCFILQGITASLLISLFRKEKIIIAVATLFFLFSTIMIERAFRHSALASHWIILFALYLYYKNKQNDYRSMRFWPVINGLAISIHPYFLLMTFMLLAASLLEKLIIQKKYLQNGLFFALNIVITLFVGYALGLFTNAGKYAFQTHTYGYFSLNLNAMINPISTGDLIWSRIFKLLPQTLGNYDGFNYLGLGIIILFIIALFNKFIISPINAKTIVRPLKENIGIVLAIVGLTLFAMSNVITINNTIITFYLPQKIIQLCGTFRASARMFYPVYYLIFLFSILYSIKNVAVKKAFVLLAVLTIIQIIDISPALMVKHQFFSAKQEYIRTELQSDFWNVNQNHYDNLIGLPTEFKNNRDLAAYAATNNMRTNINFYARGNVPQMANYVRHQINKLYSGHFDPKTLYLIKSKKLYDNLCLTLQDRVLAAQVDGLYVIAPKYNGMQKHYTGSNFIPCNQK